MPGFVAFVYFVAKTESLRPLRPLRFKTCPAFARFAPLRFTSHHDRRQRDRRRETPRGGEKQNLRALRALCGKKRALCGSRLRKLG
jgi:hypothetical protein